MIFDRKHIMLQSIHVKYEIGARQDETNLSAGQVPIRPGE